MKTMRSNARLTPATVARLKERVEVLEDKIARMELEKADYVFELGRALSGKLVHAECKVKSPDVMCITCDCWKKTREMCS